MSNHILLLNITCVLGSIPSSTFLNIQWVFQYYPILHVILSNTHFNILLRLGEYWFQYYIILPEHLADVGTPAAAAAAALSPAHWQAQAAQPPGSGPAAGESKSR